MEFQQHDEVRVTNGVLKNMTGVVTHRLSYGCNYMVKLDGAMGLQCLFGEEQLEMK